MLRTLGLASLVFAGCVEDRTIDLPEEIEQVKTTMFEIPQASPPPLDILFVIDNSHAIAAHEDHLAANLPQLGEFFEHNNGWWDRHIGVITSDVGCPGRSAWRPAPLTNDRFFIDWRHLDDTRTKNFDGTLADHLPAAMTAGHDGCGAHRPLDAILAALDPSTNFRRSDADLIIVIIGGADDQSVVDAEAAIRQIAATSDVPYLQALSRLAIVAFAPEPAARLDAFAAFGSGESRLVALDSRDLVSAFGWGFSHSEVWGAPCVDASVDLEPAPGLQANCAMADVARDRDTKRIVYERILPACDGANRPCWRLDVKPHICSTNHMVVIDRIDFPPRDTNLVGQCEILETP